MIKKLSAVCLIAVMALSLVACSSAALAVLPIAEEISSVKITDGENTIEKDSEAWIQSFLDEIRATDLKRVNTDEEIPRPDDYVTVEFQFKDGDSSSVYLYQWKENWYLVVLNQGIFQLNDSVVSFLQELETTEESDQ